MTKIGCAEMKDLLPGWVRRELEEGDRDVVAAHVASCASCAAEIDLLQSIQAAALNPPASLASDIKSAVAEQIAGGTGVEDVRSGRFVHWRLSAAATVVLALGTALIWQRVQAVPEVGPLGQDPFAAVWPSDNAGVDGVPIVAGVPMLADLSDEELALLLEELGG